jgi:hypothetical protein
MRDELGFASEIPGHTSLATKAAGQPDSHHSHPTQGVSHLRLPGTGYVSIITPLKAWTLDVDNRGFMLSSDFAGPASGTEDFPPN